MNTDRGGVTLLANLNLSCGFRQGGRHAASHFKLELWVLTGGASRC
jgi:hypothetical protein